MQSKQSNLLVIVLTISILSIIIITGPAKAFVLNLTSDKSSVTIGDSLVFNASISIVDESLPIEKIILELEGPENISCEFQPDSTILTGCKGISIKKITGDSSEYGYNYGYNEGYSYDFGYGYGYLGDLTYEITLSTADYLTGEYKTKLVVPMDNKNFTKDGPTLNINAVVVSTTPNRHNSTTRTVICTSANWQCTDWSQCINGYETRICTNSNDNCLLYLIPNQTRTCLIENNNTNSNNLGNLNENITNSTTENLFQTNRLSGITGAVIGSLGSTPGKIIIFLIITILILLSIVFGAISFLRYKRFKTTNTLKLETQ